MSLACCLNDWSFDQRATKGCEVKVRLCVLQGKAVGSAAHLTALRRESIGEYDVADAWSVPDLVAAAHAARQA